MVTRYTITADGRDISNEEWRVIPSFPKYEITKDGDLRNRETHKLLNEAESKTGNWYYSVWGNDGIAYKRSYQSLLYDAWPEDDWKEIPGFPLYLVNREGEVKSKRFRKLLPRTKSGYYLLRKDGKRHQWCEGDLGTKEQWDQFWDGTWNETYELEWRPIRDFPNYQINKLGEVRDSNGELLRPSQNGRFFYHLRRTERVYAKERTYLILSTFPELLKDEAA